jgi:chromosome segregation ATPase
MKHQRNVDGLRQNAQKKRQESFEKVDQGIQQLIKAGRPINFVTVEEASGVSKAWLYKEPEVKARIEHLRAQTGKKQAAPPKQRLSDGSKAAIIAKLKDRIQKLEKLNRELSHQNEIFGGQVLKVRELEQRLKRLEAENVALRQQENKSQRIPTSTAARATGLEVELMKLGVEMNSTLQNAIQTAPSDVLATAIASLKEAVLKGEVGNPSGFFYRAITKNWKPNEVYEHKAEQDVFKKWWELAYGQGLVTASTQFDGVLHVRIKTSEEWVPFDEMLAKHPIATLT